jgi:hypothetical protein
MNRESIASAFLVMSLLLLLPDAVEALCFIDSDCAPTQSSSATPSWTP